MAELESEDSSDGTLIIDEPNFDCKREISDDLNSYVDIVDSDDDIKDVSTLLDPSSSSTTIDLICKHCTKQFSTNSNLLNHIKKFEGNCANVTNDNLLIKTETSVDLIPKHFVQNKPIRCTVIEPTISEAVPLCSQIIPIIYQPVIEPTNIIMPSLRQVLVDEIEPEYPCTKCSQIFRHNIALLCHLNSDHSDDVSSNQVMDVKKKKKKSSAKSGRKKQMVENNDIKDNKQIENNEPVSNTINLTLLPDLKKDSLLNRMKSYVSTADKNKVICVLCNVEFKNTKKALAHVEDKHISEKIGCGYCNMKFVYELKLRSHLAKRHKIISVHKCNKCSKMINKEEYESHLEKCKEKNPLKIKTEDDSLIDTEDDSLIDDNLIIDDSF